MRRSGSDITTSHWYKKFVWILCILSMTYGFYMPSDLINFVLQSASIPNYFLVSFKMQENIVCFQFHLRINLPQKAGMQRNDTHRFKSKNKHIPLLANSMSSCLCLQINLKIGQR